jgi:hypothetical protein
MTYKDAYFYRLEWRADSVVENLNKIIFPAKKSIINRYFSSFLGGIAILMPHYSHKPLSSRRSYR